MNPIKTPKALLSFEKYGLTMGLYYKYLDAIAVSKEEANKVLCLIYKELGLPGSYDPTGKAANYVINKVQTPRVKRDLI